jgi:hypothetical protein
MGFQFEHAACPAAKPVLCAEPPRRECSMSLTEQREGTEAGTDKLLPMRRGS